MFLNAKRQTGFTLIELLIVVAIIAILAALAVPNFQEARVRSKVGRAKADLRSMALAVETYFIDHEDFPVPGDETGAAIPLAVAITDGFETRLPLCLTTPVAYVTSRLTDPFGADTPDEDAQFHYSTAAYFEATQGDAAPFTYYVEQLFPTGVPVTTYFLLSHAPDQDHDTPYLDENPSGAALYDPTNGTLSSGDVVYWGPVSSFRN